MEKLGVAVIGAGFMGEMHAKIYQDLPNAELIGVYDQRRESAAKVASSLGVNAFKSMEELLGHKNVDAVSICVSDDNHLEPTVAACEAGKHILLEKPIATNLDDATRIVEAAKENGVRLTVGHLLRVDPKYAQLQSYVESGGIGTPVSIYTRRNSPKTDGPARYGSDGILTLHVAVHDIDLILWVMKKKVVRVYAERASIALKELGIEDAIFATLKFEDGSIGCMQYNWALPKEFPTHIDAKMEIIGTDGTVAVDCADQGLSICGKDGYQWPDVMHWPDVRGGVQGALREEVRAFVDGILNGTDLIISPEESLEAVRLALAIMESLEKEAVVSL